MKEVQLDAMAQEETMDLKDNEDRNPEHDQQDEEAGFSFDHVSQILDNVPAPGSAIAASSSASSPIAPTLPPRQDTKEQGHESIADEIPESDITSFAASYVPGYILPSESSYRQPTPTSPSTDKSRIPSSPIQPVASQSSSVRRDGGSSAPNSPSSARYGPRAGQQFNPVTIGDKSVEEAFDQGVVKLRAFGKNLFSNATKLLDAALPVEETKEPALGPNSKRRSLQANTGSHGGGSPTSSTYKGKERARDPFDIQEQAVPGSPRPASIASKMSTTSSSAGRPSGSESRPASIAIGTTSSAASFASATSSTSAASSAQSSVQGQPRIQKLTLENRIQRILESFGNGQSETHRLLIKGLEHSLFSKDLSLLFPEPQDPQLRAVLARHTVSDQVVDPELVELSDEFHSYLEDDSSGIGEGLLRLWTQLDHFSYIVEKTRPSEHQIKEDGLHLLKKVVQQTKEMDGIVLPHAEGETGYWTAVEMVTLRLAQNPTAEMFEPLQDWILREVQSKYWDTFMRSNPRLAAISKNLDLPISPQKRGPPSPKPPSPSTSKITLDRTNSSLPADETLDLGDSMASPDDEGEHSMVATLSPSLSASQSQSTENMMTHAVDVSKEIPEPAPSDADKSITGSSDFTGSTDNISGSPPFSVSLTDLSPPSAYVNGHVKNRKELEFLIAVEVEGSPGFIVRNISHVTISFAD